MSPFKNNCLVKSHVYMAESAYDNYMSLNILLIELHFISVLSTTFSLYECLKKSDVKHPVFLERLKKIEAKMHPKPKNAAYTGELLWYMREARNSYLHGRDALWVSVSSSLQTQHRIEGLGFIERGLTTGYGTGFVQAVAPDPYPYTVKLGPYSLAVMLGGDIALKSLTDKNDNILSPPESHFGMSLNTNKPTEVVKLLHQTIMNLLLTDIED
jgi:hypothetical protein